MSSKQTAFVQERERLLAEITEYLRNDERFVAAWLAGSYGRGEQTWQSDLDIHVVVAEGLLCDEMEQLMPAVVEMGGYVPFEPRVIVEKRLELLTE